MPHALELEQSRARDRGGDDAAVLDRNERVVVAVHDERGHLHPTEPRGTTFGRKDRHQLPAESIRVIHAVVGELDPPALLCMVERVVFAREQLT